MSQPDRVLADLGHALRSARLDRGFSQEALALETGIHRNYIGGIERGERSPTVSTVAKLSDALGIPLSELFAMAEKSGRPPRATQRQA